jgi:hypothetical protein
VADRDPHGSRHLIERLRTDAVALGDEGATGVAIWLEAVLAERSGDLTRADSLHREAELRLRAAGDPRYQSPMGGRIGCLIQMARYEEAEGIAERLEAGMGEEGGWFTSGALMLRAWIALLRGKYDEGERRLDDAEALAAKAGYADLLFRIEVLRCETALQRGNLDVARDIAGRCQVLAEQNGRAAEQYHAERLQGLIELDAAEPEAAAAHVHVAIECAETLAHHIEQTEMVAITGDIALAAGHPAEATLLHAAASAARDRTHLVLGQWDQRRYDQALHEMRSAIGDARFERMWAEGSTLSLDEAVARARHFIQGLLA